MVTRYKNFNSSLNTIRIWRTKKDFGNKSGEKICICSYSLRNELEGYCLTGGRRLGYVNEVSLVNEEENTFLGQEENLPLEEVKMRITLDEMAEICFRHPQVKKKDFRMFCEKYIDDKTLQEIGDKYRITRERVRQKIERVTDILRKYYS